MKQMVEECEVVIDLSLSTIDRYSWDDRWLSKRGWELYVGFLYGQPIWIRSELYVIDDDFEQLALIWDVGQHNVNDLEAADAAIDAVRELVTHESDALSRPISVLDSRSMSDEGDSPYDILLDFMVYGQSASAFGKWYHASDDSNLDNRLARMFSEKANTKEKGLDQPDIMERCRYHLHNILPRRHCYLDD